MRKEAVHRRVLEEMFQLAQQLELSVAGLTVSPVRGPAGNVEFLMWLRRTTTDSLDPATAIPQVLQRARSIT
ncbi:hypothetical protein RY27_30335 [Litorilinea aerophila]|nr:hypothetical protein RY27_30335 [Litorilinea aerophila]